MEPRSGSGLSAHNSPHGCPINCMLLWHNERLPCLARIHRLRSGNFLQGTGLEHSRQSNNKKFRCPPPPWERKIVPPPPPPMDYEMFEIWRLWTRTGFKHRVMYVEAVTLIPRPQTRIGVEIPRGSSQYLWNVKYYFLRDRLLISA